MNHRNKIILIFCILCESLPTLSAASIVNRLLHHPPTQTQNQMQQPYRPLNPVQEYYPGPQQQIPPMAYPQPNYLPVQPTRPYYGSNSAPPPQPVPINPAQQGHNDSHHHHQQTPHYPPSNPEAPPSYPQPQPIQVPVPAPVYPPPTQVSVTQPTYALPPPPLQAASAPVGPANKDNFWSELRKEIRSDIGDSMKKNLKTSILGYDPELLKHAQLHHEKDKLDQHLQHEHHGHEHHEVDHHHGHADHPHGHHHPLGHHHHHHEHDASIHKHEHEPGHHHHHIHSHHNHSQNMMGAPALNPFNNITSPNPNMMNMNMPLLGSQDQFGQRFHNTFIPFAQHSLSYQNPMNDLPDYDNNHFASPSYGINDELNYPYDDYEPGLLHHNHFHRHGFGRGSRRRRHYKCGCRHHLHRHGHFGHFGHHHRYHHYMEEPYGQRHFPDYSLGLDLV